MGKHYDNELRGALFRNDRKRDDKDPDHTGSCEIDGIPYWISAWVSTSKDGAKKYFSLRFTPKRTGQHGQASASQENTSEQPQKDEWDDSIPF